jgi:radical SAM protein with 4Fe4S-binding SPASM domain
MSYSNFKNLKVNFEDPLTCILLNKESTNSKSVCGGCTAGIATIAISSNGEVYPCRRLPISIGNVNHKKLLNIWESNDSFLKDLRERNLSGKCKDCKYKSVCGGCRAVAFAINKNPLSEDPQCFL